MFSLPTPPTDNLYKFLFVAGLLILFYSLYLYDSDVKELYKITYSRDSAINELKIKSKIDSIFYDNIMAEIESTNVEWKELEKEVRSMNKKQRHALGLKADVESIEVKRKKLRKDSVVKSQIINNFNIELVFRKSALTLDAIKENSCNYKRLAILGFIFFIVGMIWWYLKSQYPQDEILRLQMELSRYNLKTEIEKANANNQSTTSSLLTDDVNISSENTN